MDDMDIDQPSGPEGSKRATNSYSTEEWKQKRELITKLYFEDGKTLKEVRAILENEHDFRPTERMYKSRLHQWGLDKKKKEHEMLELVRIGLNRKEGEPEPVFKIRGRQVTLADALHYFNRKGVKDPSTLLMQEPASSVGRGGSSSPENDLEIRTPENSQVSIAVPPDFEDDSALDTAQEESTSSFDPFQVARRPKPGLDRASDLLEALQHSLGIVDLGTLIPFRMLSLDSALSSHSSSPVAMKYIGAVLSQTTAYYQMVFMSQNVSADNTSWTSTSDNCQSDKFYYDMYQGYSFLWSGKHEEAFERFDRAFSQIQKLLEDHDVAFLIYIYDLIIRYEGTGQEAPLLRLLDFLTNMALTVFKSENHPIRLIAIWMKEAGAFRSTVAEHTLRRLLTFFQDSIGYFHPETMALLQLLASSLMNREEHREAGIRYQELVDAFETTHGKNAYETCYALRNAADAFFYQGLYKESLQALQAALERSKLLPREEEREIYVRCVRAMAEINKRIGRLEEGKVAMQHVVDTCIETWGKDHTFTRRAEMHLKSFQDVASNDEPSMPPKIYRLGRGGRGAKAIWTSNESPPPVAP